MKLALWHWHIEISSKCTLLCPRCARVEVPDSLINKELKLDFFKKNFTEDFIREHIEKITFCGDDGDPIYAKDLIEVIKYFKSVKPVAVVIITNGSHKVSRWWKKLASVLTDIDQLHFSIDGYDQASNEIYRKNSDWESIITGIKTVRETSDCWLSWDAIAFKFNEHKLDDMREMAKQLGMDAFQLTKSTKFGKIYSHYGENDELQPSDEYLSSTHRFEREIENLGKRKVKEPWLETNIRLWKEKVTVEKIKPLCHIGNKGIYINSLGQLFPCCWVANRYGHNKPWLSSADQYDLHKQNLVDVLQQDFWGKSIIGTAFECTTKCNKSVVTKNYATEW